MRAKFEELLENLKDKTLNGTDAEVTAAEQKFKSFLKEFRESFPGLNDDVLAAPSITANIENFKLEPTEQALYARSKELKELYRFMRANEIEQRLNAGKSIDESSFESLQEQLNYISCGISRSEMGEQQTPPTLSPQG